MKKFLLVEDNIDDIHLVKMAHKNYSGEINLDYAKNYDEAIKLINSQSYHLVVLDINLPRKNGLEILKYIRNKKNIKNTPVCICTSSVLTADIKKAYDLRCNAYIEKPFDYKDFVERINKIFSFWLSNVS